MDAQGVGHGKTNGRKILPGLRQRERNIVFHMPRGKKEERQHDHRVGPLRQLAKGVSQRRLGQLHIAMRHVEIGTRRVIGCDQRLELGIGAGIAAAVPDDEQSRDHTTGTDPGHAADIKKPPAPQQEREVACPIGRRDPPLPRGETMPCHLG